MDNTNEENKSDTTNNDIIKYLKIFQEKMAVDIRAANENTNKNLNEKMGNLEIQIKEIKETDKKRDEEMTRRFDRMERRLDILEEEKKRQKFRQIKQNKLRQMTEYLDIQPPRISPVNTVNRKSDNEEREPEEDPLFIEEPMYRSNFASTLERTSSLTEELEKVNKNLRKENRKENSEISTDSVKEK